MNDMPLLRRAGLMGARIACAAMLCATWMGIAVAQQQQPDDLPGRVGRVADVAGQLFLAPEDRPDAWEAIGLNYPITNGDNLWVGNDGRAEIDFGGGQFRLAGDTNLHMSRLDDRQFALFVAQGRVSVRVRMLDANETARVDTPNAQIAITRPGLYRIDVSEDREHTHLAVREGEANVQTAGGVQQVLPGQSAAIDGPDANYANVQNGIGTDGFDTWVTSRDRYYASARASANYVSPQMVGAADLAQYGTWSQTPDYGAVWYPNDVPQDWAPYRNGYWVDVGGWGPTWVDYAPWGYAPFHYGRWAYVGGRWGWCPGAYVARPRWAPAFVAWTGGSGWTVAVGGPVYGWVPLAWGEPYRPWWGRCSYGCWERYNRPYAVNVTVYRPNSPAPARYRNWDAPGGVTVVSRDAFVSRQPVQQNLVRVPRDVVATAPFSNAAPQVRIEGTRSPRPISAPQAASSFQSPAARAANAAPTTYNRDSRAPAADTNYSRGRTPVASPNLTPAPTMRQPQAQPTPAPQAQPFAPQPQPSSQPQNTTRARPQSIPVPPTQPLQQQVPQQPQMRATPQAAQPVPPPSPQRAAREPMPQPHVAPQAAPQPHVAPQAVPVPVPQPHVAPQPAPQPHTVPDRVRDNTPEGRGGGGGGEGQRQGR